jgi:TRAP-type mannitol/chloroaromatic compound transport system permease small subunit
MFRLKFIIRLFDLISQSIGKTFSWCIIILIFGTCYEVFMRYAFNNPTAWSFDLSFILYGTIFMMAGAYTLSKGEHVRGDFLYRKWKSRTQAKVDLILYFIFFFPGILAMIISGLEYGLASSLLGEVSVNSPAGVPIWPLKLIIFFSGFFLFIQGVAEVLRCFVCLIEGDWPKRNNVN